MNKHIIAIRLIERYLVPQRREVSMKSSAMHHPKLSLTRSVFLTILIFLLTFEIVGCTAMIHDHVVSTYPTFEKTEQSWPTLNDDIGRIVIYWPHLPAAGFSLTGIGGYATLKITIDNDKSTTGQVGNKTFVFADLPSGMHTFEFQSPGTGAFFSKKPKKVRSIEVKRGEIIFVEIDKTQFDNNLTRPIEASEAREALKKIHHNYKRALPFHDQPKRAMPAS